MKERIGTALFIAMCCMLMVGGVFEIVDILFDPTQYNSFDLYFMIAAGIIMFNITMWLYEND